MISVDALVDELEKIAAQKCRSGAVPIRAANLAKKQSYDGRGKKLTKLSGVKDAVRGTLNLANKHKKGIGLFAAGAGAKTMHDDWKLGRQYRQAQG